MGPKRRYKKISKKNPVFAWQGQVLLFGLQKKISPTRVSMEVIVTIVSVCWFISPIYGTYTT